MELTDLAQALDGPRATVLIDGRSGAGKSTLATQLGALRPAHIVRLDDIYPGWDGLDWASDHVRRNLLGPRAIGRPARWRQWDWNAGEPAGWHEVPGELPLILEGVGSLTAATRRLATLTVWVEADDEVRRSRALARDGELYVPYWRRWAEQEATFIARHRPSSLADVLATPLPAGFSLRPSPASIQKPPGATP
ncbi:ATP-binding protein [Agromyces endophyticus]|uniref:ATP-binding protein n=1 Tax=Agromyces sp. H17E-10 TaxID=2932244 RepID=UPI001FD26098|nr:ATP-binding protein [Agromyces sp. H17E-10]UOQ89134.1 ATP-binding protein [Agromyces sp. H17E-10]